MEDGKKEVIKSMVELKSLAIAVEELLLNQKKFFKTGDRKLLQHCRDEEARLLKWCDEIIRVPKNEQTKLF